MLNTILESINIKIPRINYTIEAIHDRILELLILVNELLGKLFSIAQANDVESMLKSRRIIPLCQERQQIDDFSWLSHFRHQNCAFQNPQRVQKESNRLFRSDEKPLGYRLCNWNGGPILEGAYHNGHNAARTPQHIAQSQGYAVNLRLGNVLGSSGSI